MADVKTSRRDEGRATRARIIEAAHAEFLERGFHGATVTSIAKRAEVASQTVYFVFHTKAELISAVIDAAVMGESDAAAGAHRLVAGDGGRAGPRREPAAVRARRGGRVRTCLGHQSRAGRRPRSPTTSCMTRHHQHERCVVPPSGRSSTGSPPRVACARGSTSTRATDVLLTVYGDATYHAFRTEHGWTQDQVVDWLADALPRLLLAQ